MKMFFRKLKWSYMWIKARYRWDLRAVCVMSRGRGQWTDFHDYPDDEYGMPFHILPMRCKRCGKKFYMR